MRIKRSAAAAVSLALLLGGIGTSASAESSEDVVDLVQRLDPDSHLSSVALERSEGRAGGSVDVADVSLATRGGGLEISSESKTLDIRLPEEFRDEQESLIDGAAVFEDDVSRDAAVIEARGDGSVQVQTVARESADQHEYVYEFDSEYTLVPNPDGSVGIMVTDQHGPDLQVGQIDAPWAFDSSGDPVTTRYSVEGSALTQTVTPHPSAQYPIVADPTVSFGVGVYVYMTGAEQRTFVAAVSALVVGGAATACVVYGNRVSSIPGAKYIVQQICGWTSAGGLYALASSMLGDIASTYTASCYENRWWPAGSPDWRIKSVSYSLCS
ncbi:hypothetical protein [Ruania halotolerans]|uniref:hypothetical protein n=1 Tax=Ruania halotolerans TaxID=2897773 RepID=UPI001E3FA103|nr:hypothetical protein [Ruania halotolerans]UFU06341.1 hypothetical protein LQF10_18255 [Ruania halotolerans]